MPRVSTVIEVLTAGAMIGLIAVMLYLALGAFGIGGAFFWLLLILTIVIGVVQYSPGNITQLNYLSIIVMVFAYLALGPYSGPVTDVTDQIKEPIRLVSVQGELALRDLWLLLTDPTRFFAEQQLRQARPERPISFPKALEFESLDVAPSGVVPSGQQFLLFAVLENEADKDARNVRVLAECTESSPRNVPRCILSPESGGVQKTASGSVFTTPAIRPGAAERFEWSFRALGRANESQRRAGETIINRIYVNASYLQNTSSSLQVEGATRAEVERRQLERTSRSFYQQVATAKVGVAQLSLNVGPQPLIDKTASEETSRASLIVSVSNTRPDGVVQLLPMETGTPTKVTITLSEIVGSGLVCQDTDVFECSELDSQTASCSINPGRIVSLTPLTSNIIAGGSELQAITAAFFCNFNVAEVAPEVGSRTGLITAEIEDYQFTVSREKRIPVGAPLGLLLPPGLSS